MYLDFQGGLVEILKATVIISISESNSFQCKLSFGVKMCNMHIWGTFGTCYVGAMTLEDSRKEIISHIT